MKLQDTDRFRIEAVLGMGGMGVVYRAFDLERQSHVALKTLRHMEPQALYRLKKEFRALQGLAHPNLVSLGELFEEHGQWFFSMELVEGVDFITHVRGPRDPDDDARVDEMGSTIPAVRGRLATADTPVAASPPHARDLTSKPVAPVSAVFDERRLRAAFTQLALGLDALHNAAKVHRDVKPSNALVTHAGRVVLVDFGLTTELQADAQSIEEGAVGTAIYMAPEQAVGRVVDARADWYSAGALLYESLTGQPPFIGPALQVMMDKQTREPAPPRTLNPDTPADLEALCLDLLRPGPEERPSGRDVLRRLGAAPDARSVSGAGFTAGAEFIGREKELDALRQAMADSERGHAVTVYRR